MTAFNSPLNTWNQRFATDQYIFGETPNAYLRSQMAHLQAGSALAVADGEGRNGVWLAEQGLAVDAFDFSENAIQKARVLAARRMQSVQWHCSDWQSFKWKASHYNNVVGIFFQFANPLERKALFTKMDASLKSGGTLIIQGYTAAQLKFNTGGPGKLAHMYDESLMREAFANYDIINLQTYEAQIDEGTAHKGMSGLLGLTARKR
ncbi:bifunctional 2-polyprenyl-6-hydroxyphenol methylase/3-demethylubiquinol 3-O-methyltransferase UbiG [Limnohabitans sp. Jir72]|uniref:class I SAM-dependent methyltransferase n=1 Tax=Limnohabitans sp. Jir72 TaxID=1977909 RepID=UPI000D34D2C2|nr:class I SAM-dependent methyltransferase [Limnohabitans sp. Jir72]PUE33762.1 SAM-dependent methyltransferase [Limnohabitans sp. Jir72]